MLKADLTTDISIALGSGSAAVASRELQGEQQSPFLSEADSAGGP